jgi:hydroxyacylglutathione hydrolase
MQVISIPVKMGPMGVMAYALLGERVVLVDTGVGGQAERILGALAENGRSPEEVSLILITHGHGDHTGSVDALKAATGAPMALGVGDEEKVREGVDREMRGRDEAAQQAIAAIRQRQSQGPATPGPEPDILISEEMSLADYGVDAIVTPLPGHTRGSLGVFTADGDALIGDLLGGGGTSRKEPVPGVFVADEAAMDASIQAVLERKPRLTYTGHDDQPFTLEQLESAFGR